MTHEETTALVRRANASGFDSIAEYAVALEACAQRLRSALEEIATIECDSFDAIWIRNVAKAALESRNGAA